MTKAFIGLTAILLISSTTWAQSCPDGRCPEVMMISESQASEDLDSILWLLDQPPEVRKEIGHRIAITGAAGTLGLMGAKAISHVNRTRFGRAIFSRALTIGYALGAILMVDGLFGYFSDGKFFPITMAIDELISIVKPAAAGTWEEYYMKDQDRLMEFMALERRQAIQILELNPEMKAGLHIIAEACREEFGADRCQ